MKKILLTHSYFLKLDPKQWATGNPYAPLGTLYAAACLRKGGYPVSFYDTMFTSDPDELIPVLETEKPEILIIYDDGFNYLTKMCLDNMRKAAFCMIRNAKQRGCIVMVSSSDSTDRFDLYLDQGADFVLLGEAEDTLLELVDLINSNESRYAQVDGLAFRIGDATIKTKSRALIRDLDSLPFPAWDMMDMRPYREMWMEHSGYFSMNLGTTRGCPFKCNWCAKPIYGNRYHSRSPEHVVRELKWLWHKFAFDYIWFCDDIFGLKPGWIREFANRIEEEGLQFKFKMQGRVDLLLQENNIRDLKRAGCDTIWMGAESGSQKILDAMDKGTRVQQIEEATRLLKANGIHPSFFIQFGYLTETMDDIEKTISMIRHLLPHEIGISVSYPLPGTSFHEKVKSQLKEKTNWTDSDELALMFKNTYKPEFYKRLHRYVHKHHRKYLAFENLRQILRHPEGMTGKKCKKALSAVYYIPASWVDKIKLKRLQNSGDAN